MLKSRFNLKRPSDDEEEPKVDQGGDEKAQGSKEKGGKGGRGGGRGRGGGLGGRGRGGEGSEGGRSSGGRRGGRGGKAGKGEGAGGAGGAGGGGEEGGLADEGEMDGEWMGEGYEEETDDLEPRVVYPERVLKRSEVSTRLSLLGKTADGDGYTYLKATCIGMSLTDISALKAFHHLQFVDVSNNSLDLDGLQVLTDLPFLVLIHADENVAKSAALKKMKYLQVLIMNSNLLTHVRDVYQPELCTLEVGKNNIKEIEFDEKMPTIKCLDFKNNMIQHILNLDFPNLDSLYLAGNKIKSLVGLETLPNLRLLHVRNNPIRLLDGFVEGLTKLQYINLRNCKVPTLRQVKKLKVLPALETLVMKGCPYMGGTGEENPEVGDEEEDSEIRIEVLATLPRLKRLNKQAVTHEERAEAKDLMMQWIEEGEKDEEEEVGEEMQQEENTTAD